jgi:hypothetical protein
MESRGKGLPRCARVEPEAWEGGGSKPSNSFLSTCLDGFLDRTVRDF